MESGSFDFTFHSIEEVARECLVVVESIAKNYYDGCGSSTEVFDMGKILLAGWSYGGVVAVELAKQLSATSTTINVASLVLFDSPLRSPVVQDKVSDKIDSKHVPPTTANQHHHQVHAIADSHFDACTRLLALYHQRPDENQPLTCAICDIRPTESDYLVAFEAVQELSSSVQSCRVTVKGSHWTMLTADFVSAVADATLSFWQNICFSHN